MNSIKMIAIFNKDTFRQVYFKTEYNMSIAISAKRPNAAFRKCSFPFALKNFAPNIVAPT